MSLWNWARSVSPGQLLIHKEQSDFVHLYVIKSVGFWCSWIHTCINCYRFWDEAVIWCKNMWSIHLLNLIYQQIYLIFTCCWNWHFLAIHWCIKVLYGVCMCILLHYFSIKLYFRKHASKATVYECSRHVRLLVTACVWLSQRSCWWWYKLVYSSQVTLAVSQSYFKQSFKLIQIGFTYIF